MSNLFIQYLQAWLRSCRCSPLHLCLPVPSAGWKKSKWRAVLGMLPMKHTVLWASTASTLQRPSLLAPRVWSSPQRPGARWWSVLQTALGASREGPAVEPPTTPTPRSRTLPVDTGTVWRGRTRKWRVPEEAAVAAFRFWRSSRLLLSPHVREERGPPPSPSPTRPPPPKAAAPTGKGTTSWSSTRSSAPSPTATKFLSFSAGARLGRCPSAGKEELMRLWPSRSWRTIRHMHVRDRSRYVQIASMFLSSCFLILSYDLIKISWCFIST